MILHKFAHMSAKFHITLIVRKYVAKPNENIYTYTYVAYKKSLIIGLVTLTLQHNVNSLWHALIKHCAFMFIEIEIH